MVNFSRSLVAIGRWLLTYDVASLSSAARPEDRVTATLIPEEGVGPELVASVEEVFKSAGVPKED